MLARRLFHLRDVEVRVEGPERVMAGEEVTFRIVLDNYGSRDYDLRGGAGIRSRCRVRSRARGPW